MRYYVLTESEHEDVVPHIVAEVVRDRIEGKDATMIAALMNERTIVLTREELLAHTIGVLALQAWDAQNDGAYDRSSDAKHAGAVRPEPKLRLIPSPGA